MTKTVSSLQPNKEFWHYWKIQIYTRTSANIQELKTICKGELNEISHETYHSLFDSYRKN